PPPAPPPPRGHPRPHRRSRAAARSRRGEGGGDPPARGAGAGRAHPHPDDRAALLRLARLTSGCGPEAAGRASSGGDTIRATMAPPLRPWQRLSVRLALLFASV